VRQFLKQCGIPSGPTALKGSTSCNNFTTPAIDISSLGEGGLGPISGKAEDDSLFKN